MVVIYHHSYKLEQLQLSYQNTMAQFLFGNREPLCISKKKLGSYLILTTAMASS